jgi:hypothetical protein
MEKPLIPRLFYKNSLLFLQVLFVFLIASCDPESIGTWAPETRKEFSFRSTIINEIYPYSDIRFCTVASSTVWILKHRQELHLMS